MKSLRDNWHKNKCYKLQFNVSTFDEILTKAAALEALQIESTELSHRSSSSHGNFSASEINKIEKSSYHRAHLLRNRACSTSASRSYSKIRRHLGIESMYLHQI